MSSWHKLVWAVVAAMALTLGLTVYGFRSLLGAACSNHVVMEIPSPDAAVKAVVFERQCGATTGISTQISILPADAPPPQGVANVFAGDVDEGRFPSRPGGGPEVRVTWLDAHALRIGHGRNVRVSLASHDVGGVSVAYSVVDEGAGS